MPTTQSLAGVPPYPPRRRLPLRVNNVATRLRLPDRTVRDWARKHKLPGFKIDGKSWGFWAEDIDRVRFLMEGWDAWE